jgi:hypothetical protein
MRIAMLSQHASLAVVLSPCRDETDELVLLDVWSWLTRKAQARSGSSDERVRSQAYRSPIREIQPRTRLLPPPEAGSCYSARPGRRGGS